MMAESIKAADGCWLWPSSIDRQGYGRIFWNAGPRQNLRALVHRLAYMQWVDAFLADDLTIDHICHDPLVCQLGKDCPHRRCCNPAHLKPVPSEENIARSSNGHVKTHCRKGHEYTPENTKITNSLGWRTCRECHRIDEAARKRTPEGREKARAEARERGRRKRSGERAARERKCADCGCDISYRGGNAKVCEDCSRRRRQAHDRVRSQWPERKVRRGKAGRESNPRAR